MRLRAGIAALAALAVGCVGAAPAQAQNPWTASRVLNIAHQGGEGEAPSNTMYAYERALRLGADMLELDIHSTADGRIVAMHDGKVDRTTDGTGSVYGMSLEQLQALDAGYDFVPGLGTRNGLPEEAYAFRGVRTGAKAPPAGYTADDFRIPTLDQVMRAYPGVPINIEIKGLADSHYESFARNADLLAEFLSRLGRTEGIIVASFNSAALERFHAQAPQIALAPSIGEVAAFKVANTPLSEGMVAFQIPITFEGIPVTDADLVQRAHAQNYAVHVWLSNDGENEEIYDRLLGFGVDGIMAAEPGRLEGVLCAARIPRPARAPDWPGGPHCSPRNSIACEVRVAGLEQKGAKLLATLRRSDDFAGRCAGKVRVRRRGAGVVARGRFDLGKLPPAQGGPQELVVSLRRVGKGAGAKPGRLRTIAQPFEGFAFRSRVPVPVD